MRLIVISFLVGFLAASVIGGCREAKEEMDEYGHAVMTLPDRTRVLSDLTRIRQSLELYKAQHEEYPASISELGLKKLYYTDEYEYDSATGKVSSKSYPTL